MDNITILEGTYLQDLLRALGVEHDPALYRVRINQREDGMAIKVNEGCWSPTIGRRADAGGY